MDELEKARITINKVDKKMAELFEKRMKAAKTVGLYKKERGIPVLDKAREDALITANLSNIQNEELKPYYLEFLKATMNVSKRLQHDMIDGVNIAYSGIEGAFAYMAAEHIFPDGNHCAYPSFVEAYRAVEKGECSYAVLPIENSYAGEVGQVLDLLYSGSLFVNGVYDLPIIQNLLVKKGTRMEDIKTVISHPQALSQCADYIRKHNFKEIQSNNTAIAARQVAESDDYTIAAIASESTAKLYDLEVLDYAINESNTNTTRFAVFANSRNDKMNYKDNVFILIFTVNNTAGSLAKAIDVIGECGFNMRVLRSRPDKSQAWNYYFYAELEGDSRSEKGKKMLEKLKEHCAMLKLVGNYNAALTMENIQE
ncbi:MAG: prephenate dehydratase domain-containing protein [Erysipelotrichaceae bacterium]|nr:prephenate dehydratase domain-containing protein [Erysipelotrichaceae bacterium]